MSIPIQMSGRNEAACDDCHGIGLQPQILIADSPQRLTDVTQPDFWI